MKNYFVYLTTIVIIFLSGCLNEPEQDDIDQRNLTFEKQTEVVDLDKMTQNGDINLLAVALNDTDKNVRLKASKLIGDIMSGKGQKISLDDQIRIHGNTQGNQDTRLTISLNALIHSLNDKDAQVRAQTANSLGIIGDIRAGKPLSDALNDNDSQVRSEVVDALGRIGIVNISEKPLRQALKNPDPEVRKNAENALHAMKLEPYPVPNTGTYLRGEEDTSDYDGWRFSYKNSGPRNGFIEIGNKAVFVRVNDTCYIRKVNPGNAVYFTAGDKWNNDLKSFSENVTRVYVTPAVSPSSKRYL
jgi:HEAT repeat protein